jgi:hypothetical protein
MLVAVRAERQEDSGEGSYVERQHNDDGRELEGLTRAVMDEQ